MLTQIAYYPEKQTRILLHDTLNLTIIITGSSSKLTPKEIWDLYIQDYPFEGLYVIQDQPVTPDQVLDNIHYIYAIPKTYGTKEQVFQTLYTHLLDTRDDSEARWASLKEFPDSHINQNKYYTFTAEL